MRVGAHVDSAHPLAEASARDADLVQFFLADPQGWTKPKPRPDAEQLRTSELGIVIHAPYVLNVATTNNRIRFPSRDFLAAHARAAAAIGAEGLVVHGGHVNKGDGPARGVENWRKAFVYAQRDGGFPLPLWIENTAGGENAMARQLDRLAALWDAIGEFGPGFCLDTCHAYVGGEPLLNLVDRVMAITGRIDLVHANDSKDAFGSGRDRHENLGKGQIDPELVCAIVSAAKAPVIVETPGGAEGQGADIAFLRERCGG